MIKTLVSKMEKFTTYITEKLWSAQSEFLAKKILHDSEYEEKTFADFLNEKFSDSDVHFTDSQADRLMEVMTDAHYLRLEKRGFKNADEELQFVTDYMNEHLFAEEQS